MIDVTAARPCPGLDRPLCGAGSLAAQSAFEECLALAGEVDGDWARFAGNHRSVLDHPGPAWLAEPHGHAGEFPTVHAALVNEPAASTSDDGAIYLWLTPWDEVFPIDDADMDAAVLPAQRPRAFDLPYSRNLHQQVQDMQERLARGEMVVGRHEGGHGWQRRFGQQDGQIVLEAPPPPPLPAKDG